MSKFTAGHRKKSIKSKMICQQKYQTKNTTLKSRKSLSYFGQILTFILRLLLV